MPDRAAIERDAWANDTYTTNKKIKGKFQNVFKCPNTVEGDKFFQDYLYSHAKDKKGLEIGCGTGKLTNLVYRNGAKYVRGVDISPEAIQRAKSYEIKDKIEFKVLDLMEEKLEEKYDVIFGLAILHHVNWKPLIEKLYAENLNPGGSMIFYEPLQGNPFIKLYHRLYKNATTENEKQFTKKDITYLVGTYKSQFKFINLFSLFTGVASSFVSDNPNNALMRLSNKLDNWFEKNVKPSRSHFRCFSFIIKK